MTIYFASSEDIDFTLSGTAAIVTTAGRFDPLYARGALQVTDVIDWFQAVISTPLTTLYTTFRLFVSNSGAPNTTTPLVIIKSGSQDVLRVHQTGGDMHAWRWDGSWTDLGALSVDPVPGTLNKITIKVILHAVSGEFTVWQEDVQIFTFSGDTIGSSGATTLDTLRFAEILLSSTTNFSEVVIADEHTINLRVATLVPNAAGANTAWTGDYIAVDEITNSAADALKSPTANQIETMGLTNYGGSTNLIVRTLFASANASKSAAGPQQLQAVARVSTTEYFSSTIVASTVYANYRKEWATNPLSAADWTLTDIDALEAGVKSIA